MAEQEASAPGAADQAEIAKFEALGAAWRDPEGAFAPLHAMQPVRLGYLRDQLIGRFGLDPAARRPLEGLSILDLGAGGGLAAEPLTRLGARVTGVDPSAAAAASGAERAAGLGLEIEYRLGDAASAAAWAQERGERYDVVVALEVIEHAADRDAFVKAMAAALKPGGLAVLTTLNRTAASFLGAIVGAEYLLGWLARGTHDWRRFPTPEELAAACDAAGLQVVDRTGFVYEPLARRWRRAPDRLEINYALAARKPA